jgi:3-(3-hydroxy-phenyl)propionate hydroxylase
VADRFRDRRVFLAGDAAHVMSPFGARGLNSGVADADNLAWKLAAVVQGEPDALLDTYEVERRPAAIENIRATDATMRFMAPHGPRRRAWRNLVLGMAPHSAWFRARVNSGRLAEPASYAGLPTMAPGPDDPSLPRHGEIAPDVALPGDGRLRERLGRGFAIVLPDGAPQTATGPIRIGADTVYGPDRAWLIRPDGYISDSSPSLDRMWISRSSGLGFVEKGD